MAADRGDRAAKGIAKVVRFVIVRIHFPIASHSLPNARSLRHLHPPCHADAPPSSPHCPALACSQDGYR